MKSNMTLVVSKMYGTVLCKLAFNIASLNRPMAAFLLVTGFGCVPAHQHLLNQREH